MKNVKICHMTSVHNWDDDRIYLKECQSLAKAGYEVYLVAEGESKTINGVHVIGCGIRPDSRKERIINFSKKIYKKALELDCVLYHFHDPELLPYALKLKKNGKKVIFDTHEDVPGQIMSKYWIPSIMRWLIAGIYKIYESYVVKNIDAVVTATPYIRTLFEHRNKISVDINNYPKLDDIIFQEKNFKLRDSIVCYAGGISEIRGERMMVEAFSNFKYAKLFLAGNCENDNIKDSNLSNNISYLGSITRKEVNDLYASAIIGCVLYKPVENHFFSQPIKLYEYMAAGLPFICTDFPLWKSIVDETNAGICVPYDDVKSLQEAAKYLSKNRDIAQEMGRNGRKAVEKKYSWINEEKKLLELYDKILGSECI